MQQGVASVPQISPRGRRQIWVPGLPVEGVVAAAASSGWDFVLHLRRHGSACSSVAVEIRSLYMSGFVGDGSGDGEICSG
jgi:hypothetical protein